jgi:hypothetical protein
MNGKKMLLIACLACAFSTMASAQGLVGAPVDPRYGSGTGVGDPPSKNPPPPPSAPGGTAMAAVAIAVLAVVRGVVR